MFLFLARMFDGNNVHLAKVSGCSESTIRNIFAKLTNKDKGQDMTLSMAFKLCNALDVELNDLAKDISIKKGSEKKKAK
jgi:DNA-binding Xre family transcriptional regulator